MWEAFCLMQLEYLLEFCFVFLVRFEMGPLSTRDGSMEVYGSLHHAPYQRIRGSIRLDATQPSLSPTEA